MKKYLRVIALGLSVLVFIGLAGCGEKEKPLIVENVALDPEPPAKTPYNVTDENGEVKNVTADDPQAKEVIDFLNNFGKAYMSYNAKKDNAKTYESALVPFYPAEEVAVLKDSGWFSVPTKRLKPYAVVREGLGVEISNLEINKESGKASFRMKYKMKSFSLNYNDHRADVGDSYLNKNVEYLDFPVEVELIKQDAKWLIKKGIR